MRHEKLVNKLAYTSQTGVNHEKLGGSRTWCKLWTSQIESDMSLLHIPHGK